MVKENRRDNGNTFGFQKAIEWLSDLTDSKKLESKPGEGKWRTDHFTCLLTPKGSSRGSGTSRQDLYGAGDEGGVWKIHLGTVNP
jgi:hypothetical protein